MELLEEIICYPFFIKHSVLSVCLGSECVSEYYPYGELRKCSSLSENTNQMASNKNPIYYDYLQKRFYQKRTFATETYCFFKYFLNVNESGLAQCVQKRLTVVKVPYCNYFYEYFSLCLFAGKKTIIRFCNIKDFFFEIQSK